MKKGIPIAGIAMLAAALVLVGNVAVDRTVQESPGTNGVQGQQDTGATAQAAGGSNSSANRSTSGTKVSTTLANVVLSSVADFLGIAPASPGPGQGQGQGKSADPAPNYRAMKIFGVNISGLEFSGLFQPNTAQTYAYFKNKGAKTVRLPFDWNEMQPDLYGDLDATSKQYLDQNIAWAKQQGMSVILDAHNYGRRYIYRDGGFSDDFTSAQQHTFQLPYGDQDSVNGTLTFRDYGRGVAGTSADPVAPAAGYRATFDVRIDSHQGAAWNEFFMDTCYSSENNRYSLVANPVTNQWSLRQTVSGVTTTLASGSKVWTLGQFYTVVIDVNQATAGKINVSIDGAPLFPADTVSSTPALARGKIAMFPAGLKATIRHFTLNVAGDTTSGGPIERRITEPGLPLEAWKDFWTRMSVAYKNEPAVLGYDHNEPHDMPVPTTPLNYSSSAAAANGQTVATATAIGQSMVDALRAAGDDKFVVVDMDHWANTHYFTTQYGANPTPWISDSLSKVVYSGHYYFDSDHSGVYAAGSTPASTSAIDADVLPFFQWCQAQNVICYEGEFGVPNTAQWQPGLAHFMSRMQQYSMWWTQWAGGDIYSSPTTLQPTNSFTTDQLQMTTLSSFLNQ